MAAQQTSTWTLLVSADTAIQVAMPVLVLVQISALVVTARMQLQHSPLTPAAASMEFQ